MTSPSKNVLITGGNRGIGFAIAQGLVAKGWNVMITSRTLAEAQQAAEKLQKTTPLELDVSQDRSIAALAAKLQQSTDHLDVLINNAGIYPDKEVNSLTISREVLESAMTTNAFGALRMVQAMLPLLEKSEDGRVINMASGMGALDGLTTTAPSYCLSKLALNGITIILAQSLKDKGIIVNSMCPGWVRTDMGGDSAQRSPEEGADTAIWLAAEAPRSESGKFWRDRQIISF